MKLLLFTQQYRRPFSGLGTYAGCLVPALAERGHEVTLAAPRSQTPPEDRVRVVSMEFEPGNVTPFRRRRMGLEMRRALRAVPDADLVHCLDAREAGLLGRAPLPRPLVGTVHDCYALDWTARGYPRRLHGDRRLRGLYYRWLRGFERRAYSGLDRIAANCEHVAEAIRAGYDLHPERISVVRLGLPELPHVAPRPLDGDPSVLFVGAGYGRKGLPVLLEAIGRLAADRPGIRLHVVGGGRLRGRAPGFVVLHGAKEREAVLGMMAGADLLAVPSFVEAVGLVYLEAMQAGTPVVATARGGTPEYLTDGEDALLVPPGDVGALTRAIERLSDDHALRRRLTERGRETARRCSVEGMLDGVEALYEKALRS